MPLKWQARYIYLQCLIADKMEEHFPFTHDIETAKEWYSKQGNVEEVVSLSLYLGRAYMNDKNYKLAMESFLDGLECSQKANLKNESGYLNSYLADVYTNNFDYKAALNKYKEAAGYFSEAENIRSYGFAYRDIGRTYEMLDLYEDAIFSFKKADSIAIAIKNPQLHITALNGLGNTYFSMGDYKQSINYLSEALAADTANLYNKIALSDVYIETGCFADAFQLLDVMMQDSIPDNFRQTIHYYYYQIYAKKGNEKEAISHLEVFLDMFEKQLEEREEYNYIEAEKKYNYLNMAVQVKDLSIRQQKNILLITFLSSILLVFVTIYLYWRMQTNKRLALQEQLINESQRKITYLSKELEAKIKEAEDITGEELDKKEEDINRLRESLQQTRETLLQLSPLKKKMKNRIKFFKTSDKPFMDEDVWVQIELEIDLIYPYFRNRLQKQHPDLTVTDIQYCCFNLYNFTTNEEAILLAINPTSVSKRRTRMREKLHATFNQINLSAYLKKQYME